MNRSMTMGIVVGAGAVGWGVYRMNERKKALALALGDAKIKAAMLTAITLQSQGVLPTKYAWLTSPESVKIEIDKLILFTNRETADQAVAKLKKRLIPASQQENVAANLATNLIDIVEEELNVNVPRSVEQELQAAATQAGQTQAGQTATTAIMATDSVWNVINPTAGQAQTNPSLGWDEFLAGLN